MNDIGTQLKAFHTASAAFHTVMAKCHDACMKADMAEGFDHCKAADAHATMAEYHIECAKSVSDELGKGMTITPAVSAINPSPEKVFAVPRIGQRPIGSDDAPAVDPRFSKIVEVD
jgi:hypothetical protein